jgi:hypothetical protein
MEQLDVSEELIRIAQNDYMIDGNYLPDGEFLLSAADIIEFLEMEVTELRQELYDTREYAEDLESQIASNKFWQEVDNG